MVQLVRIKRRQKVHAALTLRQQHTRRRERSRVGRALARREHERHLLVLNTDAGDVAQHVELAAAFHEVAVVVGAHHHTHDGVVILLLHRPAVLELLWRGVLIGRFVQIHGLVRARLHALHAEHAARIVCAQALGTALLGILKPIRVMEQLVIQLHGKALEKLWVSDLHGPNRATSIEGHAVLRRVHDEASCLVHMHVNI
mmetsp:Transcript_43068/g.129339  ORF Transcript_43068/g.129339 Transcript_43068/m.129339 type:complete len:200 (-) Transcript_43068:461-1060(-)